MTAGHVWTEEDDNIYVVEYSNTANGASPSSMHSRRGRHSGKTLDIFISHLFLPSLLFTSVSFSSTHSLIWFSFSLLLHLFLLLLQALVIPSSFSFYLLLLLYASFAQRRGEVQIEKKEISVKCYYWDSCMRSSNSDFFMNSQPPDPNFTFTP